MVDADSGRPEADDTSNRIEGLDRHGQWESLLSSTHLPFSTRIDIDQAKFRGSARRSQLGDLAVADGRCDPCSGGRFTRHLSTTDDDYLVVLFLHGGREVVSQGAVTRELTAGCVLTWDSTRPTRFAVKERISKRSLFVPRSALDEVGGRAWARSGQLLNASTPAVALLANYLGALSSGIGGLAPAAMAAARNAALELVCGALAPEAALRKPPREMVLRETARGFIERNLLDPALGVAMIAQVHGVSARTVDRAFRGADTTVGETIRRRRLARARRDLAATDRTIAAIAGTWGFSDASHFSRSFKARYGVSPTEFRNQQGATSQSRPERHVG